MELDIVFTNDPRFSEHDADRKFNDRKKVLLPELERFIKSHELFSQGVTRITFFHTGVSSLVALLENNSQKYVMKIPLSLLDTGLEGVFLKKWQALGVVVPRVIEEGRIGGHYYTLMEYVDAPSLAKRYSREEMLGQKIYYSMGATLRKMHSHQLAGFSNIVNTSREPEYPDVESWLEGDQRMKDQVAFVKNSGLLKECREDLIDAALQYLSKSLKGNTATVFCHNDFNPNNIFATDPITVFDPWPCFHHPYMDLARTLVISHITDSEIRDQLLDGYFKDESYDEALLHAFIVLNIFVKLKYQVETKNEAGIRAMKEYLLSHQDQFKR